MCPPIFANIVAKFGSKFGPSQFRCPHEVRDWPLKMRLEETALEVCSSRIVETSRDPIRSHSFAFFGKTALSCAHVTQTFPSNVLITPMICAVFLPAATTSHSTVTVVPAGTGLKYVIVMDRLTCPPSRKPGFAMTVRAVDVKLSSSVAAAPPCRLPALLQSEGETVSSKVVRPLPLSALADKRRTCRSGSVSKPWYSE